MFQSGTRQIAFVDRGGGYFEPREVETGDRAGDDLVVLKGLKAGEHIVTSANFLIDSESQLQAAMGSFAPPPPGAGAAAAMNAPAAQISLDYSSTPSPPRAGNNVFRVKLTGAGGTPVTGAQVTVTYFMAAMPAMGMAAMRTVATLSDKGGGHVRRSGPGTDGGHVAGHCARHEGWPDTGAKTARRVSGGQMISAAGSTGALATVSSYSRGHSAWCWRESGPSAAYRSTRCRTSPTFR